MKSGQVGQLFVILLRTGRRLEISKCSIQLLLAKIPQTTGSRDIGGGCRETLESCWGLEIRSEEARHSRRIAWRATRWTSRWRRKRRGATAAGDWETLLEVQGWRRCATGQWEWGGITSSTWSMGAQGRTEADSMEVSDATCKEAASPLLVSCTGECLFCWITGAGGCWKQPPILQPRACLASWFGFSWILNCTAFGFRTCLWILVSSSNWKA